MSPEERLLPQVVLTVCVAGAVVAAFASALTLAAGNTEGVDSAVFLATFGILLPAALVAVVRGGPVPRAEPGVASWLTGVAAATLVAMLAIARLADELAGDELRSSVVVLVLMLAWLGGAGVLIGRARRGLGLPGRDRVPLLPPWLPLTLLPLLALVLPWDALPDPGTFAVALLLGAALLAAHLWIRPEELLGRVGTIIVDLVVVAGILLLVSDVAVFTPEAAAWGLQLHHNTVLGPVNDVLGGRVVLVDAHAIYGPGLTYFLAGLFELVPIGYGTFGLFVAAGLAVMYVGAYAILRLAGTAQLVAATAMAAAVVSSVYSTIASPATLPSLGVLRWGFGFLLVGLALLSLRHERRARALRAAAAVLVGISSVWSFEVLVYTGATYAAVAAYLAATRRPAEGWLRAFLGTLAPAAIACVVAHIALALAVLAASGQLPDWAPYFAMVREYASGELNRVVAAPWWVGIPVGALFFASAVGVAAIVWRLPRFESENRAALVAIAGMTALGVAMFTYGVRFSTDDYVARADLPAVMVAALWLHLAWRSELARPARTAVAATGFLLAALLIAAGWDHLEREAVRTPLVTAFPGNGRSVEGEVSRVGDNPPLQVRTGAAEALLERYWPGRDEVLMMVYPDFGVELMMRTGRVNVLPVSSMLADDVIADESWDRVRPAVDRLEPGTLMLTEGFYLNPGSTRNYLEADQPPLELEQLIMDRMRSRFRLEPVARENVGFDPVMGDDELVVVRLVERGGAETG